MIKNLSLNNIDISGLTHRELDNVFSYTYDIINNLPDNALDQLLGGYDNDITSLLDNIVTETNRVVNLNNFDKVSSGFNYLENVEKAFEEELRRVSFNYFKANVLTNFTMGVRNIEWGNLVQLHKRSGYLCQRGSGKSYEFCYALPLWKLYTYNRPHRLIENTIDNRNRKETAIITNTIGLAKIHLAKIVEEIKMNDILMEKLNPKNKAELAKEHLLTETGSLIHLRSKDGQIRGLHVGTAIVDDFLDKSALYSSEQRAKFSEVFKAEIENIIEPGGGLYVSGTPFSDSDLYADLRKNQQYKVFEYPGIYPDGRILAPDRFSYQDIKELKISLGTIIFSREVLVKPISDGSSLFPWEYLNRAFIGMENVDFVENIQSFPVKTVRNILACDLAISGNIGADFSDFKSLGADSNNTIYVMNIWRKQGASHNEQISTMIQLNSAFKANEVVIETNGFQQVIASLAKERGLRNVTEFKTSANKKDFRDGLPGLSAAFERGEIKIPYKEGKTREAAMLLCQELNSITFNEDSGKLEASGSGHDDGAMSLWIGWNQLRTKRTGIKVSYI